MNGHDIITVANGLSYTCFSLYCSSNGVINMKSFKQLRSDITKAAGPKGRKEKSLEDLTKKDANLTRENLDQDLKAPSKKVGNPRRASFALE